MSHLSFNSTNTIQDKISKAMQMGWQEDRENALIRSLSVFVLHFCFSCLFLFRLHFTYIFQRLFSAGDNFIQYFPATVISKRLSLWNDFMRSGNPDFADPQNQSFYLISLLFTNILPEPLGYNLLIVSHYALAGLFTFLFLRELGLSKYPSLAGSIIFTYSGFMMSHQGHVVMINTAAWLPLLLYCIEKLSKKPGIKYVVLGACALAMAAFAGHPQILLYLSGLTMFYAAFKTFSVENRGKFVFYCLLVFFFGTALAAVQYLPTLEVFPLSTRQSISYSLFAADSFGIQHLPMLVSPFFYGGYLAVPGLLEGGGIAELTGYIGILPIIFVLFAFLSLSFQNRCVVFWSLTALISFLLVCGENTPLYRALYHVPLMNLFRQPGRYWFICHFAIAVLSTYALDSVFMSGNQDPQSVAKSRRILLAVMMVFLLLVVIGYALAKHGYFHKLVPGDALPLLVQNMQLKSIAIYVPALLLTLSTLALFLLPKHDHRSYRAGLLLLLLFDLGSFGSLLSRGYEKVDSRQRQTPLVQYLRMREPESNSYRIFVTKDPGWWETYLYPNINLLAGISSAGGYAQIMLRDYSGLTGLNNYGEWSGPEQRERILLRSLIPQILSLKYIITADPTLIQQLRTARDRYTPADFVNRNGWQIFVNQKFLPRCRFVRRVIPVSDFEEAKTILTTAGFEPASSATVENYNSSDFLFLDGSVLRTVYRHQQLEITVRTKGKSFFVLGDVFYPGWKAYVDDRESVVYKTNGTFRGILLKEAGQHQIVFRFEPESLKYGLAITFLTTAFLILLVLFSGRK